MATEDRPHQPTVLARTASSLTLGLVGFLCRSFLYTSNRTEVKGLDGFLETLDSRADPNTRERGLITVSNHISVIDDPLVWGALPFRYHWQPTSNRWSLGSYDICFKNGHGALASFFSYGQTLPMHRIAHSKYGGLFQPTMTQTIRLLSDPHKQSTPELRIEPDKSDLTPSSLPPSDPFSSSALIYSTNGMDAFPAPSAYPINRHSWVHIFPEGKIHQHPDKIMRYFKWGVARLILEAEPCPDVIPIWVDGFQNVMNEARTFPRPLPRAGNDITISFGEKIDREKVLEPFRERWRVLKEKAGKNVASLAVNGASSVEMPESVGVLHDDGLRYGAEAERLRIDVTMAIRNEVLKLRRASGLRDEDPKSGLAETWREEGSMNRSEGKMEDQSIVRDM